MTEQVEQGQPQQEQPPVAPAAPSNGQVSPPSPSQSADELASLRDTVKRLEGMVSSFQSGKDKANQKNASEIEKLKEQVASLNLSPEQQEQWDKQVTRTTIAELQAQVAELRGGTGQAPASAEPQMSTDYLGIFQAGGIDPNTPEAYNLAREYADNPLGLMQAVVGRTVQQQPKAPAPAGAISQPSGEPPTQPGADAMVQQYITEMQAAFGDPAQVRATKEAYRQKGVDVDNIGFR